MEEKNTERFSSRVEDYVKFRPRYPKQILPYLEAQFQITPRRTPIVADIGAGTGILTELFLQGGFQVTGVEPNLQMREKAMELLGKHEDFQALNGTAEATGLEDKSVDLIVCGQAFHWFNRELAKREFKRIVRDNGYVVLLWNERMVRSKFEKRYEELICTHGRNYLKVDHRNIRAQAIGAFFAPGRVELHTFTNFQRFDLQGLEGRLLSSSYMPGKADPGYKAMAEDLKKLFDHYQEDGYVQINYDTNVYTGQF